DRPRRFDLIPRIMTSALYVDDRAVHAFGGTVLEVQGGVRLDLLHQDGAWPAGVRDAVLQPRLNVEVAPRPWLRLRGGAGRVAKVPSLASLYPAPQYNDIVNVNWYANNPAERLAVLTTFILDPTNPDLGYSVTDQAEAGVEVGLGPGADLSLVAFFDRTRGAVGIRAEPTFLLRDRYQLTDSSTGTGHPPGIIEPPYQMDTIPTLLERPANNLRLRGRGLELTATLPELRSIHTRVVVLGSWVKSRLDKDDIEFASSFTDFQLNERQPRSPYWQGTTRTGERLIVTGRLIHHQPAVGLVITGTLQYTVREVRQDIGGTDTLSFAGYITRAGRLVPIPADQRAAPQYADLREPRNGLLVAPAEAPADWLFSLQLSKTLPLEGRLSFYAFNAFDRIGRYGGPGVAPRLYPATRFGVEVNLPLLPLQPGR
ncbi:MAG TPA: TonB-dependent receptor, partial [Gemmatimonadales bacterium]|nr:TonB-dependent receptor [Gemmatimonadales bacterium]